MVIGFTRLASMLSHVLKTDQDLVVAQLRLEAICKLTKTFCSKAITDTLMRVGDLIKVYFKRDKDKRGRWLTLRAILLIHRSPSTITAPTTSECPTDIEFDMSVQLIQKTLLH